MNWPFFGLVCRGHSWLFGTEFWEGDATKQKSVKRSAFSLSEVKAFFSVNEGFGKEFYRKGNSLKRCRPLSESLRSKNWNLLCSPSQISAPTCSGVGVVGVLQIRHGCCRLRNYWSVRLQPWDPSSGPHLHLMWVRCRSDWGRNPLDLGWHEAVYHAC